MKFYPIWEIYPIWKVNQSFFIYFYFQPLHLSPESRPCKYILLWSRVSKNWTLSKTNPALPESSCSRARCAIHRSSLTDSSPPATGMAIRHGGRPRRPRRPRRPLLAQGWVGRASWVGLVIISRHSPHGREADDQYGRDSRVAWIRSRIYATDREDVEWANRWCPDFVDEGEEGKKTRRETRDWTIGDGKYIKRRLT